MMSIKKIFKINLDLLIRNLKIKLQLMKI